MSSIPSSGTLRVDTQGDKAQLFEFLVDKRMKFLEYLRQMHSTDPEVGVLWMNIVRIKRCDLLNYFNVDPGFVSIATAPVNRSSASAANANGGTSSSYFNGGSSSAPSNTAKVNGNKAGDAGGGEGLSFTAAAAQEVMMSRNVNYSQPMGSSASASDKKGSSKKGPVLSNDAQQHLRMDAGNMVGSNGPASMSAEMMNMSEGPPTILPAKVEPAFIKDRMLFWYLLGTSVATMLQAPKLFPGEVFVEAMIQLLMEIEIYVEKAGSASKMLAIRSLKNYRHDNPSFWNDTEETVIDALPVQPASQGFNKVLSPWRNLGPTTSQIFFERQCCRCADKNETTGYLKYHFLDLTMASSLGGQVPPAYEAIVPSLCGVLSMAYQRFSDFDTVLKPGVAKKIITIDKKLKHYFFGALSREIAVLAQAKLVQQASFMSLKVFAAYSHADERSFMPNLQPIEKDDDDGEEGLGRPGGGAASGAGSAVSSPALPPPSLAGRVTGTYDAYEYE